MTGKKVLDNIILGLCCLSTLAALGVYYYTNNIYERPPVLNNEEVKELLSDGLKSTKYLSYKVDKLTINIVSGRSRLRYLNIITHLVPFKESHLKKFENKKPIIQDIIISVSTKMTPKELNSISGKLLLESRIKKKINAHFGRPTVKDILFSEFVVQ